MLATAKISADMAAQPRAEQPPGADLGGVKLALPGRELMNATLCASLMIFKRGHQGVSCRSSTCNISNIQIIYLFICHLCFLIYDFFSFIYIYEYIWSFSVFNKLCANPSSRRTEQSQEFMVAISNAIVLRLHMIEQSRGKHPLRSWFGESCTCICTYIYIYIYIIIIIIIIITIILTIYYYHFHIYYQHYQCFSH